MSRQRWVFCYKEIRKALRVICYRGAVIERLTMIGEKPILKACKISTLGVRY
jgi:hypothetical protein